MAVVGATVQRLNFASLGVVQLLRQGGSQWFRPAQHRLRSPFDHRRYTIWWWMPYLNLRVFMHLPQPLRHIVPPLLFGVCLYLVCLGIAAWGGFLTLFLSPSASWPIALGVFGNAYVLFAVSLSAPLYLRELQRIGVLFTIGPRRYGTLVASHIERVSENRRNLFHTIWLFVALAALGDYLWMRPDILHLAQANPMTFGFIKFMPGDAWYKPPLVPKLMVLDLIGFFVAGSIAVSSRGIIIAVGLVKDIGALEIANPFNLRVAAYKFRGLTNASAFVSFHYTVGVASFVLVSTLSRSVLAVLIILCLGSFSAALVLVPYYFLVRTLRRQRETLLDALTRTFPPGRLSGRRKLNLADHGVLSLVKDLDEFAGSLLAVPTWAYEIRLGVASYVFTTAIGIVLAQFGLKP
jgi:hypothetical protein